MKAFSFVPGTRAWRTRREYLLCIKTHERVQEIVDGEIGTSHAAEVLKRHLEACRSCNAEAVVFRDLKTAICRASSDADPELVSRLQALARELCEGRGPAE